jgi:hypothetical protein
MLGERERGDEETRSRSSSERGDLDHSRFSCLTCDAARAGERAEKQELFYFGSFVRGNNQRRQRKMTCEAKSTLPTREEKLHFKSSYQVIMCSLLTIAVIDSL